MTRRRMCWLILLLAGLAVTAWVALAPRGHPAYPQSPHYDAARQVFVNPQPLRGVTFIDGVTGLLKMLQGESQYAPAAPLPTVAPDWPLFLRDDGASRFIWFGHSTLLARLGGQTVAVDPVLGPSVSPLAINMRRFQPPVAPLDEWPRPDVVLISHNHYDQFEEATLRALAQSRAHFIVPLGLGGSLKALGARAEAITELDWWQTRERGSLRITLVPALHTSGRTLSDGAKSFWGGFVIQHGAETIYYSGDSAYGPHFGEIAARFPGIDIAFIENGQYDRRWPDNHLFPEQAAQAAADVKPRRAMPVHWGAYSMAYHPWDEPVRRAVPAMRALGVNPLTPLLGQVFDATMATPEWYLEAK